jgi:hypothetical protein
MWQVSRKVPERIGRLLSPLQTQRKKHRTDMSLSITDPWTADNGSSTAGPATVSGAFKKRIPLSPTISN